MKALTSLWLWLDGRKTTISAIGMFVTHGVAGMGWLPVEVTDWLLKAFMSLAVVGVGHKISKLKK